MTALGTFGGASRGRFEASRWPSLATFEELRKLPLGERVQLTEPPPEPSWANRGLGTVDSIGEGMSLKMDDGRTV